MRVLVGPRVDLSKDAVAAAVARALAGADGEVVCLERLGVSDLSRPLSQAEVALLRRALHTDGHPGSAASNDGPPAVTVGYVCGGVELADAGPDDRRPVGSLRGSESPRQMVAVTDHANLTWRSPLTGTNDESVGPRFPSMTGIYKVEAVLERVGAQGGMIVRSGVVAGVVDDQRLDAYERETAQAGQYSAVSSELVPVAIVAAHMGLGIAAVVLTVTGRSEEETGSGRS
jgi:hypothetical protein